MSERRGVSREKRSRVSKLSHCRGTKPSLSPSVTHSQFYHRDFETPKHPSRTRYNGCSNGDSPSETEALQDIIWDPASPPPLWNGKGAGESSRFMEISDIVKKIAPNNEKSVDRDVVLQWIGDGAVPCTPEIQYPRVRRVSARRQSNNVEDLLKLAKQFDINMIRKDEESHMERQKKTSEGLKQRNAEELNKMDKSIAGLPVRDDTEPSARVQAFTTVKPEGLSHEEELHALFDGPTQHVSGKLSPPSISGSQESVTDSAAISTKRLDSVNCNNILEDFPYVPKLEFDDDWENDDLLNDSFVLEMTQNPALLPSDPKNSTGRTGCVASRKCEPALVTKCSSSGSGSRAGYPPQIHSGNSSHYTRVLSHAQYTSSSTLRTQPNASFKNETGKQLPKTFPGPTNTEKSEKHQVQSQTSLCNWEKVATTTDSGKAKKEIICNADRLSEMAKKDVKMLGSVWGDGDDDDLLYQVCDDVERISASREQLKQTDHAELEFTEATSSPPDVNISSNSKTVQSGHPTEHKQPGRVFGRSHSVPGAFGKRQNLNEASQMTPSTQSNRQYHFTLMNKIVLNPLRTAGPTQEANAHGPSAENSTVSHHSTFKRHQSDPVTLANKVFITAQPAVKCSAAEIERKKQEAIARRRLRLESTQMPGASTYSTSQESSLS